MTELVDGSSDCLQSVLPPFSRDNATTYATAIEFHIKQYSVLSCTTYGDYTAEQNVQVFVAFIIFRVAVMP